MESIKGKYVVLAGATGGIGAATARLLAGSGAQLFLTGRNADRLQSLATAIGVPAAQTAVTRLESESEVQELRLRIQAVFPQVDVLVNAAGLGVIRPFEQLTGADLQASLNANLVGAFNLLQAILPGMKERRKGLVIHIPGILGKVPMTGAAAYSAAKYGLVGMLQCVREELKRTEIRFTNLFLGGVDSPFWDNIDLRVQRDKMIQSEEAARAIWFLCQQPASGVVNEMVLQPFNHQAI